MVASPWSSSARPNRSRPAVLRQRRHVRREHGGEHLTRACADGGRGLQVLISSGLFVWLGVFVRVCDKGLVVGPPCWPTSCVRVLPGLLVLLVGGGL